MERMRGRTVLILGASGFLGRHLMRGFRHAEVHIHGTVRASSYLRLLDCSGAIEGDLHEIKDDWSNIGDILAKVSPDIVINTTTASVGNEGLSEIKMMVTTNILYPSLLLTEMKQRQIKHYVSCGTSWQTSSGEGYLPFNFYAASKQAMEDLIEAFTFSGLSATTLRLFDTYGPGDTRRKIVNLIIEAIRDGKAIDMSPGLQKIDLVHIEDVVAAFLASAQQSLSGADAGHRAYQVSSGRPLMLRDIACIIAEASGKEPAINWGGRSYREREIMDPRSRLPGVPGWRPEIDIRTGLAQCVGVSAAV
jgi:nucleoside-diphosphate-sugar epimerase